MSSALGSERDEGTQVMAHQYPIGDEHHIGTDLGKDTTPKMPKNESCEKGNGYFNGDEVRGAQLQIEIHNGVVFGSYFLPMD